MVLNRLIPKISPIARNFTTSAKRESGHQTRGIVGSNIPFSIENRYKLTALFIVFFGSGLALPFLCLRHLLLAKN